jgi:hypothetical protein
MIWGSSNDTDSEGLSANCCGPNPKIRRLIAQAGESSILPALEASLAEAKKYVARYTGSFEDAEGKADGV